MAGSVVVQDKTGVFSFNDRVAMFGADGQAQIFQAGSEFWNKHAGQLDGCLISLHVMDKSWTHWERHPKGDELVYVLEGQLNLLFEDQIEDGHTTVNEGEFAIIGEGRWHSADIDRPVTGLFFTCGQNSEHKPRPK